MFQKKIIHGKNNYLDKANTPFRNKSLSNLKGEKWKAVPDFEDIYEVSNYGRIKSLAREIHYNNGKVIHKKECIILAGVTPAPNYFTGDYTYQLAVHFYVNRKTYNFSIARLVYHCFIRPLPQNDHSLFIIQKDGNDFNCHCKNLLAISSTDKQKRVYTRGRLISDLSWLDRKKLIEIARQKNFEPVTQYSLKGKRIRFYKSIIAASEATGIHPNCISAMIRGVTFTAGNFIWKRGKCLSRINIERYFEGRRATYRETRGKKITQYTLDLRPIKTYSSIIEAAEQTGIPSSNIGKVTRAELKTAGGFIWKPSLKK